jgi:hypothetical protein
MGRYGNEKEKHRHIVVDWYDVQQKFMGVVRDGKAWKDIGPYHTGSSLNQPMEQRLKEYHRSPDSDRGDDYYYNQARECGACHGKKKDEDGDKCVYCLGRGKTSWEGARPNDTLEWLDYGFKAKEFTHAAEYVPKSDKRRIFWNEDDGEVDIGRLYGGFDDFFLDSQIRPSRPGMRLQIEYSFAFDTSPHIVAQYGAWCAGFIRSLEITGYDLVVDMWVHLDDLYEGDYGQRTSLLVRVKRENEVSNFTEWSALFSPSGYRHLGFVAKCVGGDKIGKRAVSSLGTCIHQDGWNVKYDRQRSTVLINCDQISRNRTNPAEKLTECAIREGLIPGSA